MTLGEIAAQAATSGECERTRFAISCIAYVSWCIQATCSRTYDFNSQPKLVLINRPERIEGLLRVITRRKSGNRRDLNLRPTNPITDNTTLTDLCLLHGVGFEYLKSFRQFKINGTMLSTFIAYFMFHCYECSTYHRATLLNVRSI